MATYQSSFTTNCTLPQRPTHYVSSPNVRGTLTILWSALSALLLCTWSIQHLNVPAQWTPTTLRSKIFKFIWPFLQKTFWMLMAIVAPELFIGAALTDLISAYTSVRDMKGLKIERGDEFDWELTHGFYANMGGFVIDFSRLEGLPNRNKHAGGNSPNDERIQSEVLRTSVETGTSQTSNDSISVADTQVANIQQLTTNVGLSLPSQPQISAQNGITSATITLSPIHIWSGSIFIYPETDWDYWKKIADAAGISGPPDLDQKVSKNKKKPRYGPFMHPAVLLHQNDHYPSATKGHQYSHNRNLVADALHIDAIHLLLRNIDHSYRLNHFFIDTLYLGQFRGSRWALDARQLYLARQFNIIDHIPCVTKEEIDDRSKSDLLVKVLAIVQIFYLVIQLILRARNHQPSSQLEVAVVAFAASALITYALLLQKPRDIMTPRHINAACYPTPYQLLAIALSLHAPAPPAIVTNAISYSIPNFSRHWCSWDDALYEKSQSYFGSRFALKDLVFLFGTVVGSIIFGSLHCIAWNFTFPSFTETILWRISALVTICGPLTTLGFTALGDKVIPIDTNWRSLEKTWTVVVGGGMYVVGSIYVLARLFIIVEVVRSLFYLSEGVFEETIWLASVPSIE